MRAWSCAAVFLATLAVAASAGCKRRRELTYQPISGPGFAVVLPDSRQRGDLLATTTSDNYATGQILYGGSRPFVHAAGVAWRPGTVMTDDELEAALKAMSGLLGAKGERLEVVERPTAVSFGGTPAKRVALAGREQRLVLIETACGARSITVFAMAEDPEPILARADGSYRCLPDPAKDAALATDKSPAGLDGFDGWHRLADADTFMMTDGTIVASIQSLPNTQAADTVGLNQFMAAVLPPSEGTWRAETTDTVERYGRRRTIARGWLDSSDGRAQMLGTTWTCPGTGGLFAWVALDESAVTARTLNEATDALLRLRCLDPGEAPPVVPLLPDEPAPE
jgi:hypothetical protein